MDEQIKKLEEQVKTLEAQVQQQAADLAFKDEQIKDKDRVIQEKNQNITDLVNKNKTFKKLTEEEKAALDEDKRVEYEEKLLAHEKNEELSKKLDEYKTKEVESRKNAVIKELSGGDEKIAEKIKFNLDKLKGVETLQTEEEIREYATTAKNMLGNIEPTTPAISFDDQGGDGMPSDSDQKEGAGFAETPEGKGLASNLGIEI